MNQKARAHDGNVYGDFSETNSEGITSHYISRFEGMTVRDYIAIQAMKAIIQGRLIPNFASSHIDFVSKTAYEYADALIAESNKQYGDKN